jgi:multidrug efflux pump subunit AcrB
MAISVGICVDFICHHAHAYSHCDSNSRKDRITHSLVEMGISVVSAAVTTFTAAAILLVFTTVTFFQKFGVFLAVCMICSVVVALVYFHALLAIAGPLGGGGGLRNRLKTACNKITGRSDHDSEVLATLAVSADDITFG